MAQNYSTSNITIDPITSEANAKHQEKTACYDPIEWVAKPTDNTNDMRTKTQEDEDNVKEQNSNDISDEAKILRMTNDSMPEKLESLIPEKDSKMVDIFLVEQFSWIEASELGYDSYSLLETYWESLNPENCPSTTHDLSSEDRQEIIYYCHECHAESRTWEGHKEHMLIHQVEQNKGGFMSFYEIFPQMDQYLVPENIHNPRSSMLKPSTNSKKFKPKPKEKRFECDFCDKSYVTKGNLRSHVNLKHFEVNTLVNSITNRITEYQDSYKCSDCSMICKTIHEMQGHIVQRHLIGEYLNQTVDDDPITILSSDDEGNVL